ncbi:hypothetical protein GG804_22255 [Sphingomonas histidinilytica]|uniref:hypothetical protein n=1 Tax=Rhizorhabdus histidinilytica TaxID=439228 RepID=UPI001ADAAE51|nr:hypothetical protein [Rhizorhabdus histidinilytica]MBO9379499.1 hypothetical protein [Rhizorhabdus histidinilytica]
MLKRNSNPDQFALGFGKDAEIERIIEARVAIRAEAEAIHWRFRLVLIETTLMSGLVLAAGLALGQPTAIVLRGAVIVAVACFVTGAILIALSGVTGMLLSKVRKWRAR